MATKAETKTAPGGRPLPDDRLREMLYLLKLCRYFDERMEALYRQGRLPGAMRHRPQLFRPWQRYRRL